MHYRRLIALLMVCAYLILPLDSFANLAPRIAHPHQGDSSLPGDSPVHGNSLRGDAAPVYGNFLPGDSSPENIASLQGLSSAGEPDSHCPCSDRHGSDGCNPSCSCCSCCSFCAPLPAGMPRRTGQQTIAISMLEPFNFYPEVYLPIFVPPQNLS